MAYIVTCCCGLALYGLTCAVSVLAGLGLLRLIRLPLVLRSALLLAPVITLAFWSVGLGLGVVCGCPVRYLAVVVWPFTLGLAIWGGAGVLTGRGHPPRVGHDGPRSLVGVGCGATLCALLPIVVLFPYFLHGLAEYQGSTFPDGWSYVAFGHYLWTYPRGMSGGLAPLDEYGASLSRTRFIGASLLGFFSPLFAPGNTQMSQGLFLGWALFVFTSSCGFFGHAMKLRPLSWVGYLVLTVVSGWVANLLWANNYDNALALPYFPALAGAVVSFSPQVGRWWAILGLLGAGLVYCYPELATAVLGSTLVLIAYRCWHERKDLRRWAITGGSALGLTLALAAPYLPGIYRFVVRTQLTSTLATADRPGEGMFADLLENSSLHSALWALGGEQQVMILPSGANVVGLVLSALAAIGLLQLYRLRQLGLVVVVALLVAGAALMIVIQHYSYGAYKFLLLGWWLLAFAVVLGLQTLVLRGLSGHRVTAACALVAICAPAASFAVGIARVADPVHQAVSSKYAGQRMSQFRSLEQVGSVVGDEVVIVAVDDWLANEWAVYFLRDRPMNLKSYRMYMEQSYIIPFMRRAAAPLPSRTPYVLTDDSFEGVSGHAVPWKLVWSGGPYRLWAPASPDWILLNRMGNGALEPRDGTLVWRLEAGVVTVEVVAGQAGLLRLRVTPLRTPGAPDSDSGDFLISTDGGFHEELTLNGPGRALAIPVRAGPTRITLRAVGPPAEQAKAPESVVIEAQDFQTGLPE